MTREELLELVEEVRRQRCESADVEVKAARGGTPLKRVRESLSAFANRPGGGVLLFGVDEEAGFKLVGVFDAQRLQEDVGNLAANEMEPALRPEFTVAETEGKWVVAVEIPEVPTIQKPCYYRPAGLQGGSFIRVGASNRRMSDYEVYGYVSAREQPVFDAQPVPGATLADLDEAKIDTHLARLRRDRGQPAYLDGQLIDVLERLRVVQVVDGVVRPTLAGLLMFGVFPQQFEPQLMITFLQYYGTTEEEPAPGGARFLDNRRFEGALPETVEAAIRHVLASIRKGSLIEGTFRRDIPEYPEEAIREAVINAVAHRDYSNFARGSYVQIRLFADRLEIQSPGGLYGNVSEETLEEEQSTRNRVLVRMLEDGRLVENRGTGIRAMIGAMRRASLEPPRFVDKRSSFWVTFLNHTLMNAEAIAWLNQFAGRPLNDHQRVALAFARHHGRIVNSDYRRLNHVDTLAASRDLRGMAQLGVIEQHGAKRGAYYTLAVPAEVVPLVQEEMPEDKVLAFVREHGSISNAQARALIGVTFEQASYLLSTMFREGLLERIGSRRGTRYRLPPV